VQGEEDVMDKKPDGPKTGAMVGLGLGMVVCCAGFTLLTAGALSGLGAWLFDGGLTWLALALVLGAGGIYLWRRPRSGGIDADPAIEARRDDSKPSVTDPE
jgi:hypothetical protein